MTSVAQRQIEARKRLGLTQKGLAIAAGLTQPTISAIETGQTEEPHNLLSIAEVLKVDPYWLWRGEISKDNLRDLAPILAQVMQAFKDTGRAPEPNRVADVVALVVKIGNEFLGQDSWEEKHLRTTIRAALFNLDQKTTA